MPQSTPKLPPLAGLCTLEEAAKPGLSVAECVRRLKRFHYAFVRLHGMLTARITSEPLYELKTAFAHHAYLCAEHATAIRQRVSEMREPPLGLEEVPHEALKVFFDEIECAPTTGEFVIGLYGCGFGFLKMAIDDYLIATNPLTDAPSKRLLKYVLLEIKEIITWYHTVSLIIDRFDSDAINEWCTFTLPSILSVASGIDGVNKRFEVETLEDVNCKYAGGIQVKSLIPQRDDRFQDLWNQSVNAEAFLYDETKPPDAKALMMLFKRLREIDVPEMMARIITETKGKPWQYYRDMSRQLWDEARHAMMGEVGFTALGVDWTQCRITHNWSYRLNTECTPQEAHVVLFFIEQGLMPKTGKRYEYEVAKESGIPLMATLQDFDWADEVLHSQIGRQWLVPEFGTLAKALEYGDAAWSKITSNWAEVREKGYTQHENWWPEIYQQYCEKAGKEPDASVLAYCETYEAKRADVHRRIPAE